MVSGCCEDCQLPALVPVNVFFLLVRIFGIDISLYSSTARFIILTVLAFGLSGCEG